MAVATTDVAGAGAWLHGALLELCSTQLDPDVISSLVSYCESAPPSLAKDYLSNVIGEESCKDIITEYLHKRAVDEPLKNEQSLKDGMHVYFKPKMGEVMNSGGRKLSKSSKEKITVSEKSSSDAAVSSDAQSNALAKGRTVGHKAKKGARGVSLAEAVEGKLLISRGAPCTCQATRHKLINNCLSCGRIVCEQEGEGPCNFCGSLVLLEGSTYAGLEGITMPMSESEAAAQAIKNRLVEYGRTSSQRTSVIDDQSDYFQVDQNPWLSEEERKTILQKQEEIKLKEEARKKKMVVTIDITGQKVLMADGDGEIDIKMNSSIPSTKLDKETRETIDLRIKPNPSVLEYPVFLNNQPSKDSYPQKKSTKLGRRQQDNCNSIASVKSGRVQHDDPIISVLDSNGRHYGSDNANKVWRTPNLKNESHAVFEDEECLMDYKAETSHATVFDICEPQTGKRYSLSPSILAIKQASRKVKEHSSKVKILMPGMILLRGWLSEEDQVKIVQICRDLGIGNGGFYQPGYGTESKLHLWMMCLGMHWEPTTHSYERKRSVDNAVAPSIPPLFLELVAQCLHEAQDALENGTSRLPEMHPNICLVNFYELSGKLGLHQDKDESKESLRCGVPVVSFSIGDSAEFLYGSDRNSDEHIILESGDVIIFGGPSRLCYHGVRSILPQTMPSFLVERTNLRAGRLNLTFRQS